MDRKLFSVSVSKEVFELISKRAEAEGMSRNAFVVEKILSEVKHDFILSALRMLLIKSGATQEEINKMLNRGVESRTQQ